ncbi:MAG: DNA-processing protein DprA [Bdellovibrio sp.]|nr:DNA-processing protein DprA [Bdellovibrio sp.]
MNTAIAFKILHRRLKFRNPNHLLKIPPDFGWTHNEEIQAEAYLQKLQELSINYTYPGDPLYPKNFLKMKEPPLFIEYIGKPFWMKHWCLSVVGTRKMHGLTGAWLKEHLSAYLKIQPICIVSGGAYGVDQMAHLIAMKEQVPTVVVVPSGLVDLYPKNLKHDFDSDHVCFFSEFEIDQPLRKSHFYFRNRLIAALGEMTFMVQADVKSGSLLTVHHALEFGRPILTLPAHPALLGFGGNIKLLQEGAYMVSDSLDLAEVWNAEVSSTNCLMI